jgi:ABC-type polysaccharide/polyol phosphate transport system ATPase subunit
MEFAINIKDGCKAFALERYHATMFRAIKRKILRRPFSAQHFLALQNINIEVSPGEKIGLVGDNGSGKTTLLRTMAGLYELSGGHIETRGTKMILSGFGLGMCDELSVEENIYLYGTIYGIGRDDINKNFHEIIEWAALQKFVGAKLKTLSSGMVTRLAFSISRHVQADIYLLDEALSAGDKHFKDKCGQVFEDYKKGPKTFVVATHDMEFVRRFCSKALWLHKGSQMAFGDVESTLKQYADSKA